MARKSSSPKRTRAEPPTASDASQRQQPEEYEADAEEDSRPKKRGRPRRSLDNNEGEAEPAGAKSRKRGKDSQGEQANATTADGGPKKKRGRPSTVQGDAAEDGRAKNLKPGPKKKGRTSTGGDDEEETNEPPRQRGRKAAQASQEDESRQGTKRKRGRPSLQDLPPSETNSKAANSSKGAGGTKKKGRKPGGRPSLDDNETSTSRRAVGRQDDVEEEEGDTQETTRRRRRSSQNTQVEAEPPPMPYPHIAPRVRGIKQSTIDAKWAPLNAPSIAAASETLTLAHRPIMQRLANTQQRRQHTASALDLLHRRIARKLHRGLPFPPPAAAAAAPSRRRGKAGHEAELDFESVLDGTQALERQLDPALHAVELLRKEKAWIERELEKDYMTLRNLEAGARTQAREQREQLKKAHVLAPEAKTHRDEEDVKMVFDHNGSVPPGSAFKDLGDGELKDLALQLGGHMDSIKTNLQQTEGILPQLASSGAALRSVLLRHLDQGQYEKVVLG